MGKTDFGRYKNKPKEPKYVSVALGTGAGLNPSLKRRRTLTDPSALFKPFKPPISRPATRDVLGKGASNVTANGRVVRRARLRGPKTYAEGENIQASNDKDQAYFDENSYSQNNAMKRKNALHPRLVLGDVDQNRMILTRKFTIPLKNKDESILMKNPPPLGNRKKVFFPPRPLFDPFDDLAIVLYDPTVDVIPEIKEEEEKALAEARAKAMKQDVTPIEEFETSTQKLSKFKLYNKKSLNELLGISDKTEDQMAKFPNVPVVIDPKLAKILRPHQREGLRFLYRCTAGLVHSKAKGCIMADEMGLGKTLQCLTLMWTLLKQGPRGKKTIEKCIVVCPSSLVRNWANEIDKWLGVGVLNSLAIDGKSTKGSSIGDAIENWADATGNGIVSPVLIISYETLRRNIEKLNNCEVGLVLADEGHRLKNGDSLTFNALNSINCERRIILSGTPIQNDLSEYFSLLNFANPGLLGNRNEFRKNYEIHILRGRDSLATDKEKEKGDAKLKELTELVQKFIIRRTNDILSKYLPVKYEYVIFCGLSDMQKQLYNYFITSPDIKKLLKGENSQPLKAIGLLKKLCNHPNLLSLPDDIEGCESLIPEDYKDDTNSMGRNREIQTWYSGKFQMLERFLFKIDRETDDKIVVISNYTQTLDLVEKLCRQHKFGSLRLDGTMNISKRQKLVDKFNKPDGKEFVFLLSSKAGGCGINLIGANRLILMDPDWNPASDQQALARVWRDGQKKNCFIYRFISTGTIEEKIFQRQSAKMQLSSCVVDSVDDVERLFSSDNLKQLFQFNTKTICETHDTYKCKRCDASGKQRIKPSAMLYGDSTTWNHINHDMLDQNEDFLIQNESQYDTVDFAFQYISHLS
ncbi:DNA-dependent ATPase [Pichia kluyveri]|uniref:DNA-dependent ATPase n=1 Tax=Pichia kluyveri TaxID=36015 RepID=A0AAV5R9P5_PICKL|nr:DNA-dependent ATPase [Pichia kluyveri]